MSKTCEKIGSFATMLLLGILTYMVSEVYSFSDGTALTAGANRNMFCNRLPRDRMPVHMTCQGPCPPQAGPAPFRLEVYASTYWDEPIRGECLYFVRAILTYIFSILYVDSNMKNTVHPFTDISSFRVPFKRQYDIYSHPIKLQSYARESLSTILIRGIEM